MVKAGFEPCLAPESTPLDTILSCFLIFHGVTLISEHTHDAW